MKTKHLHSTLTFLLFVFFTNIAISQSLFDNGYTSSLDPVTTLEPIDIRDYDVNFDLEAFSTDLDLLESPKSITEYEDANQAVALFARYMIAFGGGFGFGNDETLYCLHAAYYMRLALLANSALYGSFGVVYSGLSADNFTQSLIDLRLKFMMFTAITKYKQVHLLYGLMAAYGFGTDKFDSSGSGSSSYTYDITQLTVALVLGLNIVLATQWALMLQTNVLAYQSWTQKLDDNEFKDNATYGIINKNNIFAISLVYMLANSRQ